MKIFFDTEFTGLHRNTTLISIGLIDNTGRTFYAEFSDYDRSQCDEWIKQNVIQHLKYANTPPPTPVVKIDWDSWEVYGDKDYIRDALKKWLSEYRSVELISDVCHYDMMLFIDIFGDAFDIPSNVNPACHDINQDIAAHLGISERDAFNLCREDIITDPVDGDKHNSLHDAMVIRRIYNQMSLYH